MTTADAHHDHDHDHPPFLQHHWDTPQQQFEAGKLGMWLFLATEVLLFGGLFCAYALWRFHNPEMFEYGSQFLDTKWGAINTAVLVTSSFTMALGVTMAQMGKQRALLICLLLTLLGAFGFMGIKYVEYAHKFEEGFFPGLRFYGQYDDAHGWNPELPIYTMPMTPVDATQTAETPTQLGLPEGIIVEPSTMGPPVAAPGGLNTAALDEMEIDQQRVTADAHAHDHDHDHAGDDHGHHYDGPTHPMQDSKRPDNVHMFFNIYFMMTGLHGIHVVIGGIMLVWLIINTLKGKYGKEYFTEVDLGGLYWHVVDLIWIFLFPLFYLI